MESLSNHSVSLPSLSSLCSSDDEMDIMPILGSPTAPVCSVKSIECPPVFVRLLNVVHIYKLKKDDTSSNGEVIVNENCVDESFTLCLGKTV